MAKKTVKITGAVSASPFLLPYMEGDVVSVDEKLAEELVEAKRAEYTKEKVTYKPVKLEVVKKAATDEKGCKEEVELLENENAGLSAKVEELTAEIEKLKNIKKEK